jgi:hypothetical protein
MWFFQVLLKTSVGDIDIELWTKETPKASRNFIQLCMEGYYNGKLNWVMALGLPPVMFAVFLIAKSF